MGTSLTQAAPFILVVVILVNALIIYFIFKALEFVVRSVNLYEQMVMNQKVIIGLLSDGDVAADAVADVGVPPNKQRQKQRRHSQRNL